jgi:hypothetical protein
VDPEVASLAGVAVGGCLGFLGNLIIHRQSSEAAAREERKRACLALLGAAREIRYMSREGAAADPTAAETALVELATASYEIELIGNDALSEKATTLLRRVRDYWKAASSTPAANDTEQKKLDARRAVDDFIAIARTDLQSRQLRMARTTAHHS